MWARYPSNERSFLLEVNPASNQLAEDGVYFEFEGPKTSFNILVFISQTSKRREEYSSTWLRRQRPPP